VWSPALKSGRGTIFVKVIGRKSTTGTSGVRLEVCVQSVDDAAAAAAWGAHRIELNSALQLDGLTPSHGLMVETRRVVPVPIIAMARPRAGDFCYSDSEFQVLRRDVEHAFECGADGIAFGIMTPDGRIDATRCRSIVRQVAEKKMDVVFHRAFDLVADPLESLEILIGLGVQRVMTSGAARSAVAGAPLIRQLVDQAAGRIGILPAGGIRTANALRVIKETGCVELHTSLRDRSGKLDAPAVAEMVRVTR
jgi:copper homeostasis protein